MVYKFTADGKKVAIIGALNTKETIVQEIFVTDGTEFPAGEHFVVKTLLDAPAETYQSRQKRKEEETLARLKSECSRISAEIAGFRTAQAAAASKIKWIKGINDAEVERIFESIQAAVCGEYTHVVFNDYGEPSIAEWDAKLFSREDGYGDSRRFDGVRLVSLFGVWNKRLELDWRMNTYSDGSGSNKTFIPCKSFDEAVESAKGIIYSQDWLSDKNHQFCLKYSIPVDDVKNTARINGKVAVIKKNISERMAQIAKLEADLNSIEALDHDQP